MEVRDLCWSLTSSEFFLYMRSISWAFLNSSAVCNSSWHKIHQRYSKVYSGSSVTLYQQPTHPTDPHLPAQYFPFTSQRLPTRHLYTDNNHRRA